MTLSRQLLLLILVLMLIMMSATFAVSVYNTREFVQAQLKSHAEDAATSLGLTMSPHVADDDLVTATRMLDAVFDRGYYRTISYTDNDGKIVHKREEPLRIEGVPQWFIDQLPLKAPTAEADVNSGWNLAGKISVSSHPGYAYEQLWQTVSRLFWVFAVTGLIAMLVGFVALRRVMRPLKDVEAQANAICEREYPLVEKVPRTRELGRIVTAMNRLSVRVKDMMDEQEALASRFRAEANQDSLTNLSNRRFFQALLEDRLKSDEVFHQGALFLLQINDFKGFNDKKGFAAGDELLTAAASHLEEVVAPWPKTTLARLAGADFAVLAEDLSIDDARSLAGKLCQAMVRLSEDGLWDDADVAHVGGAYYHGTQTSGELLAEADAALRASQSAGANAFELADSRAVETVVTRSASDWQKLIQDSLGRGKIRLHAQSILSCPARKPLHAEVFARLEDPDDPDKVLAAGVFMPHVQRFGLATAVDREVFDIVFERLNEEQGQSRYAINISPGSLEDEGFVQWVESRIGQHPDFAGCFTIEFPEYAIVPRLEQLRPVLERLNAVGIKVGLDNFGRGFSSFSYLQSVKLAYLKIDGSIQRGLAENKDSQFYLQTVADIAHGLEMQVYAEGIEDEAVWDLLSGLHVDGGQGYFLGRPGSI